MAVEKDSAELNFKFNYGTCHYVAMNGKAHIHFSMSMKQVDKATYLGDGINEEAGTGSELNNRINIRRSDTM